jgi:DNA-binding NarL/FixJ family response regulator
MQDDRDAGGRGFELTSSHCALTRPPDPPAARGEIRVVLVEHQALVQAALASLIDAADALQIVAVAGTLAEAARLTGELQPDILLVDLVGQWGAFEALAEIIRCSPITKVVLLDERSLDANVREALRIRAAGYLTKQQPFQQIESMLRRAAHGERVFAPDIAARLVLSAEGVRLAPDVTASPLAGLTPRETDVLIHLAQGYSVKQCAKALGIGASTAGNHKSRLMKKLNIHKTVDLTRLALGEGLVSAGRVGRDDGPHNGAVAVTPSAWPGEGPLDRHVEQSRAVLGGQ